MNLFVRLNLGDRNVCPVADSSLGRLDRTAARFRRSRAAFSASVWTAGAGRLRHAAVFERKQVTLDGFLGLVKVGLGDGKLVAELLLALRRAFLTSGEGSGEDVVAGVGSRQPVEDDRFEFVGG